MISTKLRRSSTARWRCMAGSRSSVRVGSEVGALLQILISALVRYRLDPRSGLRRSLCRSYSQRDDRVRHPRLPFRELLMHYNIYIPLFRLHVAATNIAYGSPAAKLPNIKSSPKGTLAVGAPNIHAQSSIINHPVRLRNAIHSSDPKL